MIGENFPYRFLCYYQNKNTMRFNEYRQGYTLMSLVQDTSGISVSQHKVVSVSSPYFPNTIGVGDFKNIGQNKVIDFTIEIGGGTKVYTFPEGSSVANSSDGTIFSDKEGIIREINIIKSRSEDIIKQVPLHQKYIDTCAKLLEELDPEVKKSAENDARISKIEASIDNINSLLSNFLKEFHS